MPTVEFTIIYSVFYSPRTRPIDCWRFRRAAAVSRGQMG